MVEVDGAPVTVWVGPGHEAEEDGPSEIVRLGPLRLVEPLGSVETGVEGCSPEVRPRLPQEIWNKVSIPPRGDRGTGKSNSQIN